MPCGAHGTGRSSRTRRRLTGSGCRRPRSLVAATIRGAGVEPLWASRLIEGRLHYARPDARKRSHVTSSRSIRNVRLPRRGFERAPAFHYRASKHGVIGLIRSAALEYAPGRHSHQRRLSRHDRHANGRPYACDGRAGYGRGAAQPSPSGASGHPKRPPPRCCGSAFPAPASSSESRSPSTAATPPADRDPGAHEDLGVGRHRGRLGRGVGQRRGPGRLGLGRRRRQRGRVRDPRRSAARKPHVPDGRRDQVGQARRIVHAHDGREKATGTDTSAAGSTGRWTTRPARGSRRSRRPGPGPRS